MTYARYLVKRSDELPDRFFVAVCPGILGERAPWRVMVASGTRTLAERVYTGKREPFASEAQATAYATVIVRRLKDDEGYVVICDEFGVPDGRPSWWPVERLAKTVPTSKPPVKLAKLAKLVREESTSQLKRRLREEDDAGAKKPPTKKPKTEPEPEKESTHDRPQRKPWFGFR